MTKWKHEIADCPRNVAVLFQYRDRGDGLKFALGVIQKHSYDTRDWESIQLAYVDARMGDNPPGVCQPSPVRMEDVEAWAYSPFDEVPHDPDSPEEIIASAELEVADRRVLRLEAALKEARAVAVNALAFNDWSSAAASFETIMNDAEKALEIVE